MYTLTLFRTCRLTIENLRVIFLIDTIVTVEKGQLLAPRVPNATAIIYNKHQTIPSETDTMATKIVRKNAVFSTCQVVPWDNVSKEKGMKVDKNKNREGRKAVRSKRLCESHDGKLTFVLEKVFGVYKC